MRIDSLVSSVIVNPSNLLAYPLESEQQVPAVSTDKRTLRSFVDEVSTFETAKGRLQAFKDLQEKTGKIVAIVGATRREVTDYVGFAGLEDATSEDFSTPAGFIRTNQRTGKPVVVRAAVAVSAIQKAMARKEAAKLAGNKTEIRKANDELRTLAA